jgi:LemA protein
MGRQRVGDYRGSARGRHGALVAIALLASACGYNTIQTKDEAVNAAASQIKTQLQRRADLIPNLVETVKGFAKQETTIFIRVAEARSRLAGAVQSGNLQQMGEANAALTAPLGRLLAISENYPELKSNQNFLQLQDQLEGTENRIAVARQDYNRAVEDFNAYIRRFPYNLTAKVIGRGKPREYFELTTPGAAEAPKVKF